MREIVVEIGGIQVSNDPDTYLKTYALGSCVAIMLYDQVSKTAGMAHVALSDSSINKEKSEKVPGYFADTAIPKLCSMMKEKIVPIVFGNLIVKITGGAVVLDNYSFFNIGEKNVEVIRKLTKEYGMSIVKEDVGANYSRTVRIDVKTGLITISNMQKGKWEL